MYVIPTQSRDVTGSCFIATWEKPGRSLLPSTNQSSWGKPKTRGPFLGPLGQTFYHTVTPWSYPLRVILSICPSTLLNSRVCSPLGVNKGVNIPPRGQISPLGAKFTPRDEVHPWGPGVKLRMSLLVPVEKKSRNFTTVDLSGRCSAQESNWLSKIRRPAVGFSI
jgi:hypothetical protein